jgi:isopentenyl phosphate kinase
MVDQLIVLKLGGSVITDKKREFVARNDTISRIMKEIGASRVNRLIIVHGGGSYGHPLAKQYRLSEGHRNQTQILGLVKTRQSMMDLNKILLDSAIKNHLPCVSVQPSAFIRTKGGRIEEVNLEIITSLLDLHAIPLMFGDVVLDSQLGFTILSGDQLTARLAIELCASQIVLATDVDGVFDSDPKENPKASLIARMTGQDLGELAGEDEKDARTIDVTGKMIGKMREVIPAVQKGVRVIVLNGLVDGRISAALRGGGTLGTVIEDGA